MGTLAEKRAKAREAREQRKEEAKFRFPEGEYTVRFKNWKKSTSTAGNLMFTIEGKVIKAPTEEVKRIANEKDRMVKMRYLPELIHEKSGERKQFMDLLLLLEDFGADLSHLDEDSETLYADISDIFDDIDKKSPDMEIYLKPQEDNEQYYNAWINGVENVLNPDGDTIASPAETNKPPKAPAKPKPKAPAKPVAKVEEEVVEEVVFYMDNDGEVDEKTVSDMQAYINAGYSGPVCLDGETWVELKDSDFEVPSEKKAAPKKKAAPVEEVVDTVEEEAEEETAKPEPPTKPKRPSL